MPGTFVSSCSSTGDRKSTRLNSSHVAISYAVFCLKKKKPAARTAGRRTHNDPARGGAGVRRRVDGFSRDGPERVLILLFFFFNDTATTEIYTLSLHDALPISAVAHREPLGRRAAPGGRDHDEDRKSTRLNSSHVAISYAVFCLKKKKTIY